MIGTKVKNCDQFGNITNVDWNGSIEGVVIKIKSEEVGEWWEIEIVECKLETLPDLWQVTPNQWWQELRPDQEERKDWVWLSRLAFHVKRASASWSCSTFKRDVVGIEADVKMMWNDDIEYKRKRRNMKKQVLMMNRESKE